MPSSSDVTRTRRRVSRNQIFTNLLARSINSKALVVNVRCYCRIRTYIHAAVCVLLLGLSCASRVDAFTDSDRTGRAAGRLTSGSTAAAAALSDQVGGPGEDASLLKWVSGSMEDVDAASSIAMADHRTLLQEQTEAEVTSLVPSAPPSPPKPPLELDIIPSQPIAIPDKCVFILGTGRSGSTSLLDAVNQLPNYLIRGEQGGAFWYLYVAWRMLVSSAKHAGEFQSYAKAAAERFGDRPSGWLSFKSVKQIYEAYAVQKKLPWFNDMHHSRLTDAARAFYLAAYGYHGSGIVSGFKEVRFVCGRAFPSPSCNYKEFDNFLRFLRSLCTDVKVLFNSRSSAAHTDNMKLGNMLARNGVINDTAQFEADLNVTHSWYDRYVKEHPCCGFRVLMEDMFNPEKNVTLARQLLKFLGESTRRKISFVRMPSWSTTDSSSRHDLYKPRSQDRDPFQLRRHRRRLVAADAAATTADGGATGDNG
ncbi:hypothetical protein VaNZ11_006098, partial [Volvox africanus]